MRVLIGTDGSDDAVAAAQRGLELLAPADAITVICIAETPAIARTRVAGTSDWRLKNCHSVVGALFSICHPRSRNRDRTSSPGTRVVAALIQPAPRSSCFADD